VLISSRRPLASRQLCGLRSGSDRIVSASW
jgi:hypothetical protein